MATESIGQRLRERRIFQFTGVLGENRKRLGHFIRILGGTCADDEYFKSSATHLICGKPIRSEKLLGSLAMGKWILKPNYVTESYKAKEWLSEGDYEWYHPSPTNNTIPMEFLEAPHRMREKFSGQNGGAFQGWTVGLLVNNTDRRASYKRILENGGAVVMILNLPVLNVTRLTEIVKFVFCDVHQQADSLIPLEDAGIPCVRAEYIGELLLKDPTPPVSEYKIVPGFQEAWQISPIKATDKEKLQLKTAVVQLRSLSPSTPCRAVSPSSTISYCETLKTPSSTDSSVLSEDASEKRIDTDKEKLRMKPVVQLKSVSPSLSSSKISCCETLATPSANSSILFESTSNRRMATDEQKLRMKPVVWLKSSSPSTPDVSPSSTIPYSEALATPSPANSLPRSTIEKRRGGVKRKVLQEDRLQENVKASKMKTNHSELPIIILSQWQPQIALCIDTNNVLDGNGNITKQHTQQMSYNNTGMINACFEEGHVEYGLEHLINSVNREQYLEPRTIHMVMVDIMKLSDDRNIFHAAHSVLQMVLSLHPPVNVKMQGVYLQSMRDKGQLETYPGNEWEFINDVISDAIKENEWGQKAEGRQYLLLKYLVTVLEMNFQSYLTSSTVENRKTLCPPMVANILWPHHNWSSVSTTCRDLFSFMALAYSRKHGQGDVLQLVLAIISMAGEYLFLQDNLHMEESMHQVAYNLNFKKSYNYSFSLSNTIRADVMDNSGMFSHIIKSLQPPWLCLKVCEIILDSFCDSLLVDVASNNTQAMSLRKIVSRYFYLLPQMNENNPHRKMCTPVKECKSMQLKQLQKSSPISVTSSPGSATKKRAIQINKRNLKGETQLHTSCIKNNVERVKEILAVPGVDVNVSDNAGWTPLHEACNHGHIECVKALLNFKPMTITKYFKPANEDSRDKLNLLATDEDGITPLHDAVQNSHVEVVKLLLQYGRKHTKGVNNLLDAQTKEGKKPIDYASIEEMKQVLTDSPSSDTPCKRRLYISSQSSFSLSQESQISSDTLVFKFLPPDEIYNNTNFAGSSKFVDIESCAKFVTVIYNLLKSYIQVFNIDHLCNTSEESFLDAVGVLDEPSKTDTLIQDDRQMLKDLLLHVRGFETHISKIVEGGKVSPFSARIHSMKLLAASYDTSGT